MPPLPDFLKAIFAQTVRARNVSTVMLDETSVALWPADANTLETLRRALAPLCGIDKTPSAGATAQWKAGHFFSASIVDAARRFLAARNVAPIEQEAGNGLLRHAFSAELVIDFDPRQGTVCCRDLEHHSITLVTSSRTGAALPLLADQLRGLLAASLIAGGWRQIDAAALRIDGMTCLLLGAGGQRLTPLLLSMLRAGGDFIAGRRCFLKTENGAILVKPFPDAIPIDAADTLAFPELARALRDGPREMRGGVTDAAGQTVAGQGRAGELLPEALCRALGGEPPLPGGRVAALLLPQDGGEMATILSTDTATARAALRRAFRAGPDPLTSGFLPYGKPAPLTPSAGDVCQTLLTRPLLDIDLPAEHHQPVARLRRYLRQLSETLDRFRPKPPGSLLA